MCRFLGVSAKIPICDEQYVLCAVHEGIVPTLSELQLPLQCMIASIYAVVSKKLII